MKNIPLAILIGATLVAPLASAQSNVTVYGKLYPFVVNEKGSGASDVTATAATLAAKPTGVNGIGDMSGMAAGNSRLGFSGKEDMGGNFFALFHLEGTVAVDSGGGAPFAFNRNTFVGLEGRLGTLRMGNIDTVLKEYGDTIGMLGVSSGTFMSTSDVLRKTGFGTSSASSFHLRRVNSIRYDSPEVAGFQAALQYSTDEAKTDTRDPRVISMGLAYDKGPIYLAIAHEIHYDLFGGSRNAKSSQRNNAATDPTNSNDKATQVTVEWRMNKQHKFEFDVIRKSYNENATVAGRFESYSNTAYLLAMENRWTGLFRTSAHYVKSSAGSCSMIGGACSTAGLDGSKFGVGASYYLSKRTYVFGSFSQITNGSSARFNNAEINSNDPSPGEDIRIVALGLSHSF